MRIEYMAKKQLILTGRRSIYVGVIMTFVTFSVVWLVVREMYMKFEKAVTIQDKYIFSDSLTRINKKIIVDDENNSYVVSDAFFKGELNGLDNYNKIKKGKHYVISGSGRRVRLFNLFPVVYNVEEMV